MRRGEKRKKKTPTYNDYVLSAPPAAVKNINQTVDII